MQDYGTARYWPRNLVFVASLALILCVWFALFRVGLMWRNTELLAGVSAGQMFRPFAIGFRFDLATTCYVLIPVSLLVFLPFLSADRTARTRRVAYWFVMAITGLLSYLLLAEFEYVREFQVRYNRVVLNYLDQADTVGRMLWQGYPVIRYTLLWLAAMIVFGLGLRQLMRRIYSSATHQLTGRYCLAEAGCVVLVVLALIIGMRGGFQSEPLRWGDAFTSDQDVVNQFSLNGIYVLGKTIVDSATSADMSRQWLGHQTLGEARRVARGMVLDSDDQLTAPDESTVLRTGHGHIERLISLKQGITRPNIVVVIMESFSGQFSSACGAAWDHTPNFDAIAREGILFDHAFSIGIHTHQGIYGTLLSFPNLPGCEGLMQSSLANQSFTSLPAICAADGYQTMFIYNGRLEWDNMLGFFRKQGIGRFIGGQDFPETARRDGVWGVDDLEVFKRANQEFESAAQAGPFMGVILTLSNHAPWNLPEYPGSAAESRLNEPIRGIHYADWAVGQFISEAKKLRYFENTLFVFVGDHAQHGIHPKLTAASLLGHHVPLLFYGPGVLDAAPRVDSTVACQLNVLPTILGLINYDHPQATWGTDLFSREGRQMSFAVFKGSGGDGAGAILRGDRALVFDGAGQSILYRYGLGTAPFAEPLHSDDPEHAILFREIRGFTQSAITDLRQLKAGDVLPAGGSVQVARP